MVHHLPMDGRLAREGVKMAADFGRVETCACCGKNIKKPVTMKRFPGKFFGKDCRDDIVDIRDRLRMAGPDGESRVIEIVRTDWPRTADKLIAWARG